MGDASNLRPALEWRGLLMEAHPGSGGPARTRSACWQVSLRGRLRDVVSCKNRPPLKNSRINQQLPNVSGDCYPVRLTFFLQR